MLATNCIKGSIIEDTTNTSNDSQYDDFGSESISLGARIGILVAIIVVGLSIIIVGVICCYKAFKKSNKTMDEQVLTEFQLQENKLQTLEAEDEGEVEIRKKTMLNTDAELDETKQNYTTGRKLAGK